MTTTRRDAYVKMYCRERLRHMADAADAEGMALALVYAMPGARIPRARLAEWTRDAESLVQIEVEARNAAARLAREGYGS